MSFIAVSLTRDNHNTIKPFQNMTLQGDIFINKFPLNTKGCHEFPVSDFRECYKFG